MQEATGAGIPHSVDQILLLGTCNPGQRCKAARWSKGSSGSSDGAQTPAEEFAPNPFLWCDFGCILGSLASLNSCFPRSDSLIFLLLLWVTYWFSIGFPLCQGGFYCLHPVIQVLVHCSCPWLGSPNVVNSLSTVSTDTFQSYFCIVLKISSSRWSMLLIILWYS